MCPNGTCPNCVSLQNRINILERAIQAYRSNPWFSAATKFADAVVGQLTTITR
jgi:hypothetical protein